MPWRDEWVDVRRQLLVGPMEVDAKIPLVYWQSMRAGAVLWETREGVASKPFLSA